MRSKEKKKRLTEQLHALLLPDSSGISSIIAYETPEKINLWPKYLSDKVRVLNPLSLYISATACKPANSTCIAKTDTLPALPVTCRKKTCDVMSNGERESKTRGRYGWVEYAVGGSSHGTGKYRVVN